MSLVSQALSPVAAALLNDMCVLAGQIGRLQIRRSGKMELVIGDVVYDLHEGTSCHHLQVQSLSARALFNKANSALAWQEIVAIDHTASTPSMTSLGLARHRYVAAPDISQVGLSLCLLPCSVTLQPPLIDARSRRMTCLSLLSILA